MSKTRLTLLFLPLMVFLTKCGQDSSKRKTINGNVQRDSLNVALTTSLEANQLVQPPTDVAYRPIDSVDDDVRTILEDNLVRRPSSVARFELDSIAEERVVTLLRRSLAAGESVDDRLLTHLKDDLRDPFRKFFIAGNKLYLEGLIENNPSKQIDGNDLIVQWADYWEQNNEEILSRMYPTK